MDNLLNEQLDQYLLTQLLDNGPIASVYQADDLNLEREQAIKVFAAAINENDGLRAKVKEAYQSISRISDHDGILAVKDLVDSGDNMYVVTRYMEIGNLKRLRQSFSSLLGLFELGDIGQQITSAVAYAHSQGVVHGNLKPENILFWRQPANQTMRFMTAVADFGLADIEDTAPFEDSAKMRQTWAYRAPEQLNGYAINTLSDIYSAGAILYYMVVGRPPVSADSRAQAQEEISGPVTPITELRPELPSELNDVIMKALEKSPADRYQSMEHLATDIAEACHLADRPYVSGTTGTLTATSTASPGGPSTRTPSGTATSRPTPVPESPPTGQFDSTETQTFMSPTFAPEEPEEDPGQLLPSDTDWIIISPGSYRIDLDSPRISIGRADHNDIILQVQEVSSQHAEIRRTDAGWAIIDLGSSNGVRLGRSLITPNSPEVWSPSEEAHIGPYSLTLHLAHAAIDEEQSAVSISLAPTDITVTPGTNVPVRIEIFNRSDIREYVQVELIRSEETGQQQLPISWYNLPYDGVPVEPKGQEELSLRLLPPNDAPAKTYHFQFRATSRITGEELATVRGTLRIESQTQFIAEASPTLLDDRAIAQVFIHNEGNTSAIYSISVTNPDASVRFARLPEATETTQINRGDSDNSQRFNVDSRSNSNRGNRMRLPTVPGYLRRYLPRSLTNNAATGAINEARMRSRQAGQLNREFSRLTGRKLTVGRPDLIGAKPARNQISGRKFYAELYDQVQLGPGDQAALYFVAEPRRPPPRGQERRYPIQVQVQDDSGSVLKDEIELRSSTDPRAIPLAARIAMWVLPILAFLAVLLFVVLPLTQAMAANPQGIAEGDLDQDAVSNLAEIDNGLNPLLRDTDSNNLNDSIQLTLEAAEREGVTPDALLILTLTPTATPAPTLEPTVEITITPTAIPSPAPITTLLYGSSTNEGSIIERGNTNTGGLVRTPNQVSDLIIVGDNEDNEQVKGIISFNTSSLQTGSINRIDNATLVVYAAQLSEDADLRTFGRIFVDVDTTAGVFDESASVTTGDFQANGTQIGNLVVQAGNTDDNVEQLVLPLTEEIISLLETKSEVQFRIYFELTSDGDEREDWLALYAATTEEIRRRPQIIIDGIGTVSGNNSEEVTQADE